MERRSFLRNACRACLLGVGSAAVADSLASCSPKLAAQGGLAPTVVNNQFQVPLSLFDKEKLVIITPEKYEYEVAVEKQTDTQYKALLLRCTHYDNQLLPNGSGYSCSLHGSRFNKEGAVVKGPAAAPLKELKTTLTNDQLLIHL